MNKLSSKDVENFYKKNILPKFDLPHGDVVWQGESGLDIESFMFYFYIGKINYLLVNESYHGADNGHLIDLLIGNAVAPHQKVMPVRPKEGVLTYVRVSRQDGKVVPYITGDFSVFRIVG